MSENFLPYGWHTIEEDDVEAVKKVLLGESLTTGPQVELFERELSQALGAPHAVSCANGTAALHLASIAIGLGPGDAIITTPITFLATANAARFCGADVIFSDVDPVTYNLDPARIGDSVKLARKKGLSPRAIYAVDLAGHPADLPVLRSVADENGLVLLEDSSHSIGATYEVKGARHRVGDGKHAHLTTFSFHPVKQMTTGEGGAVLTASADLAERMVLARSHGMVRNPAKWKNRGMGETSGSPNPWYYEMQEIGFNYRLTDIQCALGRTQLNKLRRFVTRRREIADLYRRGFAECKTPHLGCLSERSGFQSSYHLFVVMIDFERAGKTRSAMMEKLKEKGIGTQVHYIPVNLQPYYLEHSDQGPGSLPVAESYYRQCLSLPMYPAMNDSDVQRVIKGVDEFLRG